MAIYTDNLTNKYKISDMDTNSDPKYYGFLAPDGSWFVMKEDSTAQTYRYSRGEKDYSTAWINRATLTYVLFNVAF